MKYFIVMLFSLSAFAEVSQEHVTSMLDQMVKENVISQEEAEKAKFKMKNMSPSQWEQINQTAASVAARAPASVSPSSNNIQEVNKIDLDGAQFKQIQEDIKKIMPEHR